MYRRNFLATLFAPLVALFVPKRAEARKSTDNQTLASADDPTQGDVAHAMAKREIERRISKIGHDNISGVLCSYAETLRADKRTERVYRVQFNFVCNSEYDVDSLGVGRWNVDPLAVRDMMLEAHSELIADGKGGWEHWRLRPTSIDIDLYDLNHVKWQAEMVFVGKGIHKSPAV